jgi:hypothetical protein
MLNAPGRIMGSRLMVVNGQVDGLALVNQGFHLGDHFGQVRRPGIVPAQAAPITNWVSQKVIGCFRTQ